MIGVITKRGTLDTRHRYTQKEADVNTLGGYHVKMEDWVMHLQASAHLAEQQRPGRGQEGSSLQVSEYGPPDTLLLTPSFQNGEILSLYCVKPPSLWCFVVVVLKN